MMRVLIDENVVDFAKRSIVNFVSEANQRKMMRMTSQLKHINAENIKTLRAHHRVMLDEYDDDLEL